MERVKELLKYADLTGRGIEIAPYFNPAVPKRDGYNVLIVDVFDTETLRTKATNDANIPKHRIKEIEPVDIVADASGIGDAVKSIGLVGMFDYICSSHNFEHLPNPIRFLQGASEALKPGGILSMAVPDYRACFDHFRMPTRLADWLAAYFENRTQPSPETLFDYSSLQAMYERNGIIQTGCDFDSESAAHFNPARNLISSFNQYKVDKNNAGEYRDAHCSVFFPESLELLLSDLRRLGMIDLELVEITRTHGLEFFVHLRNSPGPGDVDDERFYSRRTELLTKVSQNLGAAPYERRAATEYTENHPELGAENEALKRALATLQADCDARRSRLAEQIDFLDYRVHRLLGSLQIFGPEFRKRFTDAASRRKRQHYK